MIASSSPRRVFLVAVVTITLSLLAILGDGRKVGAGPFGSAIFAALSPWRGVVGSAGRSVHNLWIHYVALTEVSFEKDRLQAEINELKEKVMQTADLRVENERLRRLLDLADSRKDLRLQAARVVSQGNSSIFRVLGLVIDIGDSSSIEPGMPVLATGGVVGQIRLVMGSRAEVLLVTDPRSAVDVVLEDSRARGVANGTGDRGEYTARLEFLQGERPAVKGERVLTTGDEGRYPRGLVLGEVIEVGEAGSGTFQRVLIRPAIDLGALDEVLIVLGTTGLNERGGALEFEDEQ